MSRELWYEARDAKWCRWWADGGYRVGYLVIILLLVGAILAASCWAQLLSGGGRVRRPAVVVSPAHIVVSGSGWDTTHSVSPNGTYTQVANVRGYAAWSSNLIAEQTPYYCCYVGAAGEEMTNCYVVAMGTAWLFEAWAKTDDLAIATGDYPQGFYATGIVTVTFP